MKSGYLSRRVFDEDTFCGPGKRLWRLFGHDSIDVFWEEPPDPDDPIFSYNVLATPHIAGSTDVSMRGIVNVVAENIRRLEKDQEPLYLKYPER